MKRFRENYWFKYFLLPLIVGIILVSLSFLMYYAVSCENEQKQAYIKDQKLIESEYYIKIGAMDDALVIIDELLWMVSKQHEPKLYGRIMNDKGICFYILAEKKAEDTEINLEKSIQAYKGTLEIRTKEKYPEEYAETMKNLGVSYLSLSKIQDTGVNIEKAMQIFNEALEIRTKEEYPEEYAETMNNLGVSYWALSKIKDEEFNLRESIKYYDEALQIYTPEKYPDKNWEVREYKKGSVEKLKRL